MVSLNSSFSAIHRTEVTILIGKLANSISNSDTLSIDNKIVIYNDSPYGYWRSIQWCPKGSVIIGITEKIDSEKFDNAGITNFGARCGRPEDRTEQPSFLFGMVEYNMCVF